MKKELREKKPFRLCPSYDMCSAPVCPLDSNQHIMQRYPEEEKCKANKPTRIKIGSKFPELLPHQGLTSREWLGKKRWNEMSDENKGKVRRRLALTSYNGSKS